jgi:lipopolysaccharide/colanic/teichoic acid biosynthesis glycosyltransferase
MEWWQILFIVLGAVAVWIALSALLYRPFFKRFYDFVLSLLALIVLSPLLFIITIATAIAMGGDPFFTQLRPGKKGKDGKEKIFKLVKFRTMSDKKDEEGNLLPDEQRLNKFGSFLRSTSLDELLELINILKGDMSIVGSRPLLVKYLPLYSEEQRKRHNVRPGLTGYAQVNGRNAVTWEERFDFDVQYTDHISLFGDLKIIFKTVFAVLKREGISSDTSATMEEFTGTKTAGEEHG